MNNDNKQCTRIFALGGLGEVGKNMYVIEHQDEIIIIDAGVMFPSKSLLGIDYVLPDFNYLKENKHKIKGLFITHGHEDHIGAIPFLLKEIDIPGIYANMHAGKLIERKVEDRGLPAPNMVYYDESTVVSFKHFVVTFFAITHSIPDAHGIHIKTPNGTIATTGDYTFDLTPIGPVTNIHKMAKIGEEGLTLLLSDSTNCLRPGFSMSESKVDEALAKVFSECEGRIILATFASNVYRLKHIIETCRNNNRKIAIFGRSMENNINISIETGHIKDDGIFVSPEVAKNMKPKEICLLCTGSQGEPLAALSRIAKGTHKHISLMPSDTVIFSSSPIPGNALSIATTLNLLYLKGVNVYTNSILSNIHTSGHPNEEEAKLTLRIFKPKYFLPVHGEYLMLRAHAALAVECDIPEENTFVMGNGEVLEMCNGVITKGEPIIINDMFVDGNRVGDTHGTVMRDRAIMAADGILVVIANISITETKIIGRINITTRGFILINENIPLLKEIEKVATNVINDSLSKKLSIIDIKNNVIGEVNNFIVKKMDRRPIILPLINEIKEQGF